MENPSRPGISTGFVVAFYAFMGLLAFGLATFFGDLDVLVWHDANDTPIYLDAALGVGVGVAVVLASNVLDRKAEWARELGREFGRVLGSLSVTDAFLFALASGIGEELLFRGFLQQVFTVVVFEGSWFSEVGAEWAGLIAASIIFGLLHMGPNIKKFWPWTVMALVLGAGFGWMYLYTGNVLAPILAHFTVNFFNLQSIGRKYGHLKGEHEQQ
jgi:membrane protease YdiL (CAAX protease family)